MIGDEINDPVLGVVDIFGHDTVASGCDHLNIDFRCLGGKATDHACAGRVDDLIAIALKNKRRAFKVWQTALHFSNGLPQLMQAADRNVAVIDIGMFGVVGPETQQFLC